MNRQNSIIRGLALGAALIAGTAGAASAQSLIGDEVTIEGQGVLAGQSFTVTVGAGVEATLEQTFLGLSYGVDIDATGITITDLNGPGTMSNWGSDGAGGFSIAFTISGLDFDNGAPISGVTLSGTGSGIDAGDADFTANSVTNMIPSSMFSTNGGQIVRIDLETPLVANVTQGTFHTTLQDALDNANSGDAIEIAAGTLFESDLAFPAGIDLTIRGAGPSLTSIDAQLQDRVLGLTSGTIRFERIAFRNGRPTASFQGGLSLRNSSVHITDCHFIGNEGTNWASAVETDGGSVTFTRCEFRDNTNGTVGMIVVDANSSVSLVGCVFTGNSNTIATILSQSNSNVALIGCEFAGNQSQFHEVRASVNATVDIVSCTIVSTMDQRVWAQTADATVNVANTVFDTSGSLDVIGGPGTVFANSNLYNGAPASDGNIDGVPTFVDAANGDYRLAPGSLGIDAADVDAYVNAAGGLLDLAGAGRYNNDPGTPDSGVGAFTFLDMGAYEFQGQTSGNTCVADVTTDGTSNGVPDGDVTLSDFSYYLGLWAQGCP
ncbi:MAG: GC-type dockerin domain-anchored protein [Planctomycetota bacterium]